MATTNMAKHGMSTFQKKNNVSLRLSDASAINRKSSIHGNLIIELKSQQKTNSRRSSLEHVGFSLSGKILFSVFSFANTAWGEILTLMTHQISDLNTTQRSSLQKRITNFYRKKHHTVDKATTSRLKYNLNTHSSGEVEYFILEMRCLNKNKTLDLVS